MYEVRYIWHYVAVNNSNPFLRRAASASSTYIMNKQV